MYIRRIGLSILAVLFLAYSAEIAKAVDILADTAVTSFIPTELERGSPPEGTHFPLVYYLVDGGLGVSLAMKYNERDVETRMTTYSSPPFGFPIPGKRIDGIFLPVYLGYITVNADYSMTFTEACGAGSYVEIFLDGYRRPYTGTRIPNAERTAKVAHDSWNGVMVVLDALKKNGTLVAMYKTSGLPPDPTFRPKFAKTTIVLLDVLRSVTFTPPYDAVDARITNPCPA